MKFIQTGITRTVLLIGKYAIKFPNGRYQHDHFLKGCYCNWKERYYTKIAKGYTGDGFFSKIAPTIFCTWFGLVAIQIRVKPLENDLTDMQLEDMKDFRECKKENYGMLNGKLVCVDYGY